MYNEKKERKKGEREREREGQSEGGRVRPYESHRRGRV